MRPTRTRTIVIGAVAALAVAGGGAAVAATQLVDPKAESDKIVTDAAKDLGVTPAALTGAIEKAMKARVDAAVAAGTMTKEQGDALKQRIESGELPLFAGPGKGFRGHNGGFGHHRGIGKLDAAAGYLGLTEEALRAELRSGKSLADVAKAKDKSVDGLVTALVAAATKKIDAGVTEGRLTTEQATSLKADLKERITDLVNGTKPAGFRGGKGLGHGFGGGRGLAPAGLGGATF